MHKIMSDLITITGISVPVLVMPGVNFVLVMNYSATKSLSRGCLVALGISTAVAIHAILACFGINIILESIPKLFKTIQFSGGLFLLYIGISILYKLKLKNSILLEGNSYLPKNAFLSGFFTDILNPFIIGFYWSLFSGTVTIQTSIELIFIAIYIFILTLLWFTIVALTSRTLLFKNYINQNTVTIGIITSIFLIYYGTKQIIQTFPITY